MERMKFLEVAMRDPRVGALTASSPHAVKKIVGKLHSEYKYIVEYGPGDGPMTKAILEKLPADGKLVAIELNREFIAELQKISDPRFIIVRGDVRIEARNLSDGRLPKIDAVVSGIPFTLISQRAREEIVKFTYEQLAPNGMFLVYQYTKLMLSYLKRYFGIKNVNTTYAKNIPRYVVMEAVKK